MSVKGLDHVNIIAEDLDATARFYGDLLDLRRGETPGTAMGFKGAWLHDTSGKPIIHLMGWNDDRHADLDRGSATGSIDHVALACEDFAGTVARCEALGVEHRVNDRKYGDLRQVFVRDPNNVMLELNFAGD
ncbi:VOC family protein [Novosphingobium sp. JCM 18896]|uniref:VOC family protein n=1 Tax=Novosphingobium sp. JCM 18896 TaxID=2989731 RepID=UPI00222204D5|nr:VOC family protein [Novosphingobium sp. JCM 18896]MCW1431446.1 VOC family protein [Novosphingobium sp. JCM 18896]